MRINIWPLGRFIGSLYVWKWKTDVIARPSRALRRAAAHRFGPFSDRFGPFSDRSGPFSDRFGSFSDRLGRIYF